MKSLVIVSLLLPFFAGAADSVTGNVVKCSDQTGRVLIIDRNTGNTPAGALVANVLIDGKAIGFPQPVKNTSIDVSFGRKYEGGDIIASINGVETMDLPATQVRGFLQLKGTDAKPVPMLCNKGPAYFPAN